MSDGVRFGRVEDTDWVTTPLANDDFEITGLMPAADRCFKWRPVVLRFRINKRDADQVFQLALEYIQNILHLDDFQPVSSNGLDYLYAVMAEFSEKKRASGLSGYELFE